MFIVCVYIYILHTQSYSRPPHWCAEHRRLPAAAGRGGGGRPLQRGAEESHHRVAGDRGIFHGKNGWTYPTRWCPPQL